ncbi:PTS system, beta-glucosides-specific IIC component [Lactobacillus bombicola]|uniref:PTS system, beta-glucosides-specific IIC component n=1 Tax=Lactobacillus bombicola TaxID=1505723 RepID=A0A1I1SY35_9LACO|nr:PTS transporter subunit EIIC [Lactobacillus bombicola]SFD51241.1 PTS system, beta-glucosides-specific IIC component [Lactobacillus bombicola]
MDKINKDAVAILKYVGGPQNVNSLVHCVTRLRFELKDSHKIDEKKLNDLSCVLSIVHTGGQDQIVIGPNVAEYYDIIQQKLAANKQTDSNKLPEANSSNKVKSSLTKIISGAFMPLLSIMSGAGMVKAILTVLTSLHWLSATSTPYLVLAAAGNSVFYFLPIFVGITLAKEFKADPFVGGALGAALLEPSFTHLIGKHGLNFLGMPLDPIDYSTTVFPIFVIIGAYVILERLLKRIIPQQLQIFLNSTICLIILVPATVLIFGPFGNTVGNWISTIIMWLFGKSRLVAGLVLGASYSFLTVLGLHWGLVPITLQNLKVYGGDVIGGVSVCAFWAQIGVALGAFLYSLIKSKNAKLESLAGSVTVTGIFAGVTEPILYGLIMPSKRLIIITAIAGGLGGAVSASLHVVVKSFLIDNIFSILMMMYEPIGFMILGSGTALLTGALLTYFWGFEKSTKK